MIKMDKILALSKEHKKDHGNGNVFQTLLLTVFFYNIFKKEVHFLFKKSTHISQFLR